MTGAVNRETTYTYTYVFPPTGKLHYPTDGVNYHLASFTRGVQMAGWSDAAEHMQDVLSSPRD